MNPGRLNKIKQDIDGFRTRGGIKSAELESLAKRLGRVKSDRGKEPTWVNKQFPHLRPLSIPHHGSSDLNRFTARGILDQLEEDIEQWEELL
jgi:hypothetical protein